MNRCETSRKSLETKDLGLAASRRERKPLQTKDLRHQKDFSGFSGEDPLTWTIDRV